MAGKLFIISAPSGAGKTSLVDKLLDSIRYRYRIKKVITYTSKPPRFNEKEGRDYYFLTEEAFRKKIDEGFFMEWSDAYRSLYGSPRSIIDEVERGRSYVLIIDRVGAQKIAELSPNVVLIWIYTKGLDVLRERLNLRGRESAQEIEYRLERARQEIEEELNDPLYDYHILNDDFERALHKLERLVKRELADEF